MASTVTIPSAAQLDEPTVRDLLLVLVAGHEAAFGQHFLAILEKSDHYARIFEATAEPIRRQDLISATKVDSTNISKLTVPLVRAGWLRAVSDATGLIYRRSPAVDALLRGRTVANWKGIHSVSSRR